ncbi:transporter substrate-binding domain-containing protein [Peribacillus cavernae]|uniref:transporter substrate-binding domain-containing protein n=1 Tax=Peribacillus cavernae TaxID=1674310 RepID=UPI003CCC4A4C
MVLCQWIFSIKVTGFDIEITQEVFKRLDFKPKFVETKWDGMIAGLGAKRHGRQKKNIVRCSF